MPTESVSNNWLLVIGAAAALITATGAAIGVVITAWRTGKTVDKIHVLVNSGRTANLRMLAKTAKRLAVLSKDPQDMVDYETALRDLQAAEEATRAVEREMLREKAN